MPVEADLDAAVALVNTVYALDDPPDSLTHVGVFQHIVEDLGQVDLASHLHGDDLPALRALREQVREVFNASDANTAARLLNEMLLASRALPQLHSEDDGVLRLDFDGGQRGIAALRARIAAALALHVAEHGTRRLGVCHAAPCGCVFVDRTRGRTRRFCCDACNDRAAAAAYRSRRRPGV
jgi:predicted RNA-binding Zn ribbon-like protein